jgi:hypothetical protein
MTAMEIPPVPDVAAEVPRVPAWITDPDAIESIECGVYEIDDDLAGEA